ncbi:MAG: AMP-binding protein [Proteobacteria bacterium]|nr:AMP-binding protein [Pseudomonadota bacterium]MBU1708827.1 AMP-binding protein [Pseudomonadota bacterium]
MTLSTLNDLIQTSAREFAGKPAVSFAFEKPMVYRDFQKTVRRVAAFLSRRKVTKGDTVAILAENSPNWGIAYFAIVRLGAIAVPILPDFTGPDVRQIIADSGATILFTTEQQIEKIYEMKKHPLRLVITLDNFTDDNELLNCMTFRQCIQDGKDAVLPDRAVTSEDPASIIYTSGTSGHSKAVVLTHSNFMACTNSASRLIAIRKDWTFLSMLPMSHTYEFSIGFLLPLMTGARIVYTGKPPTPTILHKICQKEKPDVICVVPVIMEKIYKKRVAATINNNKLLNYCVMIPGVRNIILKAIGRKLLDFFGGRLQLAAIGGAPMIKEIEIFFYKSGFPYLVGYGLTETAPLLSGGPFRDPTIAVGSSGKPIPGVEIRINDPDPRTGTGEILARGPNIMQGYYKNPELTAQTIDADGWLSTGDLGYLDDRNNLFITGRSKSVIVLAHGENIYPETIEDKINANYHVAESLVIDNNGRLEAIIYLDYDLISLETGDQSQAAQLEYIGGLLDKIQKETNAQLPLYSRISKCIERREPFVKTATHKIKRYLYSKES